jgi:hypothetical protein
MGRGAVKQPAADGRQHEGSANRRVMRNGQNKRMRGRNRKGHHHQNPLTRMYESNGPDVKIRGTANHVAEKYLQLARDAQGSGDPIAAENYYQHAEHYFRLIAAAQEQFRQSQPFYRPEGESRDMRDDSFGDGDDDPQPSIGQGEPGFVPREHQSFQPRDQQPYPAREPQPFGSRDGQQQHQQQQHFQQNNSGRMPQPGGDGGVDRLPSFITGGQSQQSGHGQGPNGYDNQGERYQMHRRRRRHRGPRGDMPGGQQSFGNDGGGDDTPPSGQPPHND